MSERSSIVSITVRDRDERAVLSARVFLRAAGAVDWMELRGDPIPLGDYTVRVQADGYETQQFPLEVKGAKLYTAVILGRPGEPYYVQNGRRIYYTPEPAT